MTYALLTDPGYVKQGACSEYPDAQPWVRGTLLRGGPETNWWFSYMGLLGGLLLGGGIICSDGVAWGAGAASTTGVLRQ